MSKYKGVCVNSPGCEDDHCRCDDEEDEHCNDDDYQGELDDIQEDTTSMEEKLEALEDL